MREAKNCFRVLPQKVHGYRLAKSEKKAAGEAWKPRRPKGKERWDAPLHGREVII